MNNKSTKVLMPDIMKVEHNVRVLQEAKSLKNKGYDVQIIGFSNKTKTRKRIIDDIEIVSYYLNDSRTGFGKIKRYFSAIKMILSINLYILFTRANIYHAHNFHVLPACWLSALLHRGKLIYDSHESWTIHRNAKYHPEHIFAYIIEKIFIRFISGFITVNEMVAEYYSRKYKLNKTTVIYNVRPIVELERNNLIREKLNISDSTKIVIFVGGFWPSGRGIFELIESAKFVKEGVVVVFMGYGSQSMIDRMTSEIKKNKVEEKVFIIPPQPPEKVADFVMSADIGANLIKRESKAQDFQSPWKLFEYCLGGLAIISTDLPFHKKIYSKYKVGLLCDTNNSPVSIAESINNLITDNVLYTEAQENARFAVENEFNWKNQELKLLKLYKEVLGE